MPRNHTDSKEKIPMAKRISALLAGILIILASLIPAFAAEEKESGFISLLKEADGRTLGVSFRGDTKNYPENSIEGIVSAAETGIDAVLVNVTRTSDGELILFADTDTKRMLASGSVRKIAEMTFGEISALHLKDGEGGIEKETEYTVPSLSEALNAAKEKGISLVLSADAGLLPEIAAALDKAGMLGSCAVTLNAKAGVIEEALGRCEKKPVIMGEIRNNIIFKVTSYEKKIENMGGCAVTLRTTNRYGVNYYRSALSLLEGRLRAVADLSDMLTAGSRADTEKWWDDLISRGYSVIVTKEPALFAEYLSRTADAKNGLAAELESAKEFPLPVFKKEFLNDYVKAYNDAVAQAEALLADDAACCRDLRDTCAALVKAVNDINFNYEGLEDGTAGLNVTPVSIFLCVFAVALVLSAQIFVFKKRMK